MSAPLTAFDRDTAVGPLGDGRYGVTFDPGWWVVAGPNGGHVAAMIVRALRAELGSAERALRSLSVHYPSAPREGPAEIAVRVERVGRGMTTLSARLTQGDRLCALALAACSAPYPPALELDDVVMPEVPMPEDVPAGAPPGFEPPAFARNFTMLALLGPAPFSGGERAITGGWLRLVEGEALDEALVVAITDSWWPAVFGVVGGPLVAPTIDLTIHVRAPLPRPDDWVLVEARTALVRDGFFEEDARVWARDGTLLAQARQLALAL